MIPIQVLTVMAVDPDEGSNANITYSFISASPGPSIPFEIGGKDTSILAYPSNNVPRLKFRMYTKIPLIVSHCILKCKIKICVSCPYSVIL